MLAMEQLFDLASDVSTELLNLHVEPRLQRRAARMLGRLQEKPGLGFPEIFQSSSELEGAYRFYNNPSITFDRLLAPHVDKSVQRCRQHGGESLCIHDTSTFVFGGEREGLGYINKANRGFLGHFALAVSRAGGLETPLPFGVVAARTWVRTKPRSEKKVSQHRLRQSDDCESHRWLATIEEVQQRFDDTNSLLHVMDREGDIYDSLSTMVSRNIRFVVRAMSNRRVDAQDAQFPLLFDTLDGLKVRFRETITVTPRKGSRLPDQRKTYPSREGRTAQVCVSSTSVVLKRTRNSSNAYPAATPVNVVHVFEPNPPTQQCPVEWILLTTEPIDTDDSLRSIIDSYRQRWLIEEYFKAIKSGCAYEKRQLESYHALTNALAMTLPLAWSMLLFRAQSRAQAPAPADQFVESHRLKVLRAASKRAKRYVLPDEPNLKDVAYAIAALGGHLKRNGPPGWQTLRRGFDRLLALEEGWIMSRETCDQS